MAKARAMREGWRRLDGADDAIAEPGEVLPTPPEIPSLDGTFIASGAVFEGRLSLSGDFRIDTEYRGALVTDGTITIGPNGSVVGDIHAREVVIQGAVVGDVVAPRQLVVEAHGKLHGDIETACLEIQKYAFFRGKTSMTQPQASRRSAPAADPPAGAFNA